MPLPKYHIYIEYTEPEKSGIRFNITHEELNRTFAEPFNAGQPFWFMGRLLNPIKVNKAVVFWSYETADKLKLPSSENLVVSKDKKYLIECIQKSKVKGAYVCTEKFLTQKINTANVSASNANRRVFVISGSDDEMKQAVTKALTKLWLVPIVSCEDPGHCRKIVEQPTDYSDVNFAVALLSPDDYAYAKNDEPSKRKFRPTQEVVFELGFVLGKLGKNKVLVIFREAVANFETPEIFANLKVAAFDDRDSWKLALLRELGNNGYVVDADRILK